MKLNLPEQNTPTATSTPSNPRKLKNFLSTLPDSNIGELTKQIFQILRDLNRQTMPSKHRLENLEVLRQLTGKILSNDKKYPVNCSLPPAEKNQKIDTLKQSILQELIYGYEIIVDESANKIDSGIDAETLRTSTCRAINYQSEMLLHCSEVYKSCPKNLWHDAHQLYLYAEARNLVDDIIIDKQGESENTTIGNSYKQILLFTLAKPMALRHSDSNRVYKELFKWSQYANIQREAAKSLMDCVFCMRVNEDTAPHYLREDDLAENVIIRTLDTSKLVSHVKTLIAEQNKQKQQLAAGDTIPLETLMTLVRSWDVNARRQFSRTERQEHINVAIGLSNICKAMQNSSKNNTPADSGHGCFKLAAVSKETPIDSRRENDSSDVVEKGLTPADSYNNKQLQLHRQDADSHWEMVNISAGGYCLRWNSDGTSKAQIGELIALQEVCSNNSLNWHIGVIRWMQFTQQNGLEIGVQILSPEVSAATVQDINHLDEPPFACLMLPDIKALKQTASIILPSTAFKTNYKLVTQVLENKMNITLGEAKEITGSFIQFSYVNTALDKRTKEQMQKYDATKNKDEFDELRASL